MPRDKNDMVGQLDEIGNTTVKVNGVVYKVAEASQKYLKYYKPGDRVYIDIKDDDTIIFMQEFSKWKAKYPSKAQKYDIQEVGVKAAEKAVEAISGGMTARYGTRDELEMMKSAAACATGLVKSMIERSWFSPVDDDTFKKVRVEMNQLMIAIYEDEKQILSAKEP